MKDFNNYEKKSSEVTSKPFVLDEGGEERIMTRLICSSKQQKELGYSDEKVKKILFKTLEEHCYELGQDFDAEPVYHKNEKGSWTLTAVLQPKKLFARTAIRKEFKVPTIKSLFDKGVNKK